ncbi:MAG: threonine/serine dehydratase [Atribacterota bacterium]|nr:threonine/serine dehydratase [Atribacterota bacterium]
MINLQEIIEAKKNITNLIKETELRESIYLSNKINGQVFLKLENLQTTNAFKIRGAFNKLLIIKEENCEIVTASSGNHGQAIALACQKMGLKTTIFLPEKTPEKKIELIKKYGAQIIIKGDTVDQAEEYGRLMAEKENKFYISPYNDPAIIAGQGTIGLEIIQQYSKLQSILVPIGGGGLISGIAIAVKENFPDIKIIGIQAENDAAMYHSFGKGKLLTNDNYPHFPTIADGLAGGIENNSMTFPIIQKYVDDILLIKEDLIEKSIYKLWKNENLIVEGAGAVSTAAVLGNPEIFYDQKIALIVSGGNINENTFKKICAKYSF